MPVFCGAYGCNNRRSIENKSRGITFHKFPSNTDLRRQWEVALRREGFVATESSKLCSEHFKPEDFDRTGQIVRLRDAVTPSVFNFSSHLQRSVKTRNTKTLRRAEESQPVDLSPHFSESEPQLNDDHSYALPTSPTRLKTRLSEALGRVESLEREKRNAKAQEQRAKKSIKSLLEDLERTNLINVELKERLDFHSGVGVFCCRDCGAAFREEAAYLEHRHLHPQQNTYLNSQSDAEKDNETPYFCTLCSLSFVEINELRSHMKNHNQTSDIVNNSGLTKHHTCVCPDCGKTYAVIGHFLNHLRSHRQPSKSVFNDLEHLKKKSFQCESCGRNYSRASALDAHRRCHEEKLIKSKNRSLGDNVEIGESSAETKPNENQTKNDSGKHFECLCGKRFSTASRLKTHQRFSRNSRCAPEEVKRKPKKSSSEFYCTECNKTFNGHIALFNHQRWHTIHSTNSTERFPCEECGKVFMTLTFYYRHQRMAHSAETPAKSFLHQVCQVQKKAFECKDCGLKFSRASALQSHQLQHTDVFKETEQGAQTHPSLPHQDRLSEGCWIKSEHSAASLEEKVQSEIVPVVCTADESPTNETDDDTESYEPGDFNVQVISDSESEDEAAQDLNPDLELLCESDQDVRDDAASEVSPGGLVSKSDFKIVQIDFDQTNREFALIESGAETQTAEQRFDCPECYRWFTNPTSLRVHRMWHGVRKRRQQNQGQSVACEPSNYEAQFKHTHSHSGQTPSSGLLNQAEALVKKTFTCNECGDVFSQLSALVSHQLHHPERKLFQCPDCMMSYLHAASLSNHMKTCPAQKREKNSVSKKEYNPKKTLLGPKIYHCEQCGKGFWSLGAFSHHKQNQMECTDLRLRKGLSGSLHSNGRSRSMVKVACPICGRKFRHKGIMALHMRRHENGNHRCEICNRSFRLFSSLLRHEVVHSDQLLPPPIKSFQHQVDQLKKNTYSCPDCGKLFSRAKALQFHMKSHGYESGSSPSSPQSMVKVKNLQCATCFAHFNNRASLRAHRKLCVKREGEIIVKTEPSKNDALEMCSYSDTQEYSDQIKERPDIKNDGDIGVQQIEMHTSGGNVENPGSTHLKYKCNTCDRSFSVAGALNFHKRSRVEDESVMKSNISRPLMFKTPNKEESGKGLIHCSDCGRRFMTKSALGSHKWWHKEKKCSQSSCEEDDFKAVSHKIEDGPFHCEKCEKQFFNHRVLHRHQVFNPLCQIKTEPDLNRNEGTTNTPEQFSCHENEHCKSLKVAEQQGEPLNHIPELNDVNTIGTEASPPAVKPKAHQCPLCSLTFAKARGLHAHKWQAHSKSKKCKQKRSAKTKRSKSNSEVDKADDSGMVKGCTVGRERKQIKPDPQPEKFISCLDCGEQCSSAASLLDHKKVCSAVKQESKAEIETLESTAEVPPALSRLLEHTVKCLFKCDKCGKAFQTEEQLRTHKNKAKSRPHCCALCCHGFWTENQLQQHLAWHDEVRLRLPNEVRFRLSAAVTSNSLKPNTPVADKSFPFYPITQPPLNPAGWWQKEPKDEHCGEAFLSQNALEKHKSQQGNNLYRCLVCSKTFSHVKDLIDHHQECMSGQRGQSDDPAAVLLGDTNGLNLS